jgi:hypothetical protein
MHLGMKLFVLSFVCIISTAAQKNRSPLELLFQQDFDTTVIYRSHPSAWLTEQHYFIAARKNNSTYTYAYTNNAVMGPNLVPGGSSLMDSLIRRHSRFFDTAPAVNEFFSTIAIPWAQKETIWNTIQKLKLWVLEDDRELERKQVYNHSTDGGIQTLILIDKQGIKDLNYYNLEEKVKQHNHPSTNTMLQFSELIWKHFGPTIQYAKRL